MAALGPRRLRVGGVVRDELLGRDAHRRRLPRRPASTRPGCGRACPRGSRRAARASRASRSEFGSTRARRGCARSRRRESSSRRSAANARPGPAATTSRSSSTRRRRVADDLARRDFTSTRSRAGSADGQLVDPFDGAGDLERGVLRPSARAASPRTRCVSCAGCASSPSFALEPDGETLAQMREHAAVGRARLRGAHRRRPRRRRDGRALEAAARGRARPRARARARLRGAGGDPARASRPAIGLRRPGRRTLARRAHPRGRTGERRCGEASARPPRRAPARPRPCRCRRRGRACGARGADRRADAHSASATRPRCATASPSSSRLHTAEPGVLDERAARRLLARHGEELSLDLLDLREADLRGKGADGDAGCDRTAARLPRASRAGAREPAPPRRPRDRRQRPDRASATGPGRNSALRWRRFSPRWSSEPERNRRETLLARARELLAA